MTAPRLATGIWVDAYLTRLRLADIPVFVTAKGDPTAGAVLVVLNTLDGRAKLWGRMPGPDWTPVWAEQGAGTESEIAEAVAKRRRSDPDLWVLEVEDRHGRALLHEPGLD